MWWNAVCLPWNPRVLACMFQQKDPSCQYFSPSSCGTNHSCLCLFNPRPYHLCSLYQSTMVRRTTWDFEVDIQKSGKGQVLFWPLGLLHINCLSSLFPELEDLGWLVRASTRNLNQARFQGNKPRWPLQTDNSSSVPLPFLGSHWIGREVYGKECKKDLGVSQRFSKFLDFSNSSWIHDELLEGKEWH